ncbi:MAG: Substrate-specific component QueT (COG4708) of predicted queuosine-regulated ECF transporter, partial [uncultured Rubrobacteraceae bacterium]
VWDGAGVRESRAKGRGGGGGGGAVRGPEHHAVLLRAGAVQDRGGAQAARHKVPGARARVRHRDRDHQPLLTVRRPGADVHAARGRDRRPPLLGDRAQDRDDLRYLRRVLLLRVVDGGGGGARDRACHRPALPARLPLRRRLGGDPAAGGERRDGAEVV